MELSKRQELSKQIIDNPELRYCEVYKLTNLIINVISVMLSSLRATEDLDVIYLKRFQRKKIKVII